MQTTFSKLLRKNEKQLCVSFRERTHMLNLPYNVKSKHKSLQVDVLGGSTYLFIALYFIHVTMRLALTKGSVLRAI